MNVLSEVLGEEPLPWIVSCRMAGNKRSIACSSYATREQAKQACKDLNAIFCGGRCGKRYYTFARRPLEEEEA